ncbi:MAG: hypothetical protein ABF747_08865, partial [Bifidobacterium sp.]|uniref:hypothetical protein n=1 Tax=Bifidobacterium sp. TaxID=41200 RepID=UPI0039ED43A0
EMLFAGFCTPPPAVGSIVFWNSWSGFLSECGASPRSGAEFIFLLSVITCARVTTKEKPDYSEKHEWRAMFFGHPQYVGMGMEHTPTFMRKLNSKSKELCDEQRG